MKCVIQAIPSRIEAAKSQARLLTGDVEVSVDHDLGGPLKGFMKSLRTFPADGQYRFHMQDDLILAQGLRDYLPVAERMMSDNGLDYLSFYAPRFKAFPKALKEGKTLIAVDWYNYLPLLGCILSPLLMERLVKHEHQFDPECRADDMYLSAVMKHYKTKAFYHIPSLVQHDISLESSVGNANNRSRTSVIFDEQFVNKWKASR